MIVKDANRQDCYLVGPTEIFLNAPCSFLYQEQTEVVPTFGLDYATPAPASDTFDSYEGYIEAPNPNFSEEDIDLPTPTFSQEDLENLGFLAVIPDDHDKGAADLATTSASVANQESAYQKTTTASTNPVAATLSQDPMLDSPKIPRPPNAYILYRKDHHPIVKAANPGIHNNGICKFHDVHLIMPFHLLALAPFSPMTLQ